MVREPAESCTSTLPIGLHEVPGTAKKLADGGIRSYISLTGKN